MSILFTKRSTIACLVILAVAGLIHGGDLTKNFYKDSCPLAEEIVKSITWKRVASNSTLPAKLLRMHFHDCFVRGCDGSVLIDSTAKNKAEKAALPNRFLAGFDVIEEAKTQLEKTCPGTISCADILALAARDSVSFQFKRPMWEVLTGRRDGIISRKSEAVANVPSSSSTISTLIKNWNDKGLTVRDLVVLSGGHTIGTGHCRFFSDRLYNFTGKGDPDPTLDSNYAAFLKTKCRTLSQSDLTIVDMDPQSPKSFDTSYYVNLKQQRGVFQSDAVLLDDKESAIIVDEMLVPGRFFTEFGLSMKRMGAIGVLTGSSGEIRRKCNVVNS